MPIKEDEKELDKLYYEICQKTDVFFKADLQKIVIGSFYVGKMPLPMMQIWVLQEESEDYITLNSYFANSDVAVIELQEKCDELHEFCKKYGDDWKAFTFILRKNGKFNAKYEYEPIKTIDKTFLLDWKVKFFYND